MMSDLRDVFDNMIDAMQRSSHLRQLRDMVITAANTTRRECGNCDHWMKRPACPREKGVMKGGPSCSAPACDKFSLKARVLELRNDRIAEAIAFAEKHKLPMPAGLAKV